LAVLNLQKGGYTREALSGVPGCSLPFSAHTFNEFVLRLPISAEEVNHKLLDEKIVGGLDLSVHYPELGDALLVCVTEKTTRDEIDSYARTLESIIRKT
jgi:glycine dehydrogenase subunit 1